MGMYDTINLCMHCPYCEKYTNFDAQTKDLGSSMWEFTPLREEWFNPKEKGFLGNERKFRTELPVCKIFPFDKSNTIWKNQAEKIEACAKVENEYNNLKYVNVIADCHSRECQYFADKVSIRKQGIKSGFGRSFTGKIKIENGCLIGKIYDIDLSDEMKISSRVKNEKKNKIHKRKTI